MRSHAKSSKVKYYIGITLSIYFLKNRNSAIGKHSRLCKYKTQGKPPKPLSAALPKHPQYSIVKKPSTRTCNNIVVDQAQLLGNLSSNLTAGIVSPYV